MSSFELVPSAYAQSDGAPPGGTLGAFMPIILMFMVFYFLLIRPQQKKVKEHQEMVQSLERGDEVVTQGGIHGTVVGLTENVATIEVGSVSKDGGKSANNTVRIKVDRESIARRKGGKDGAED